MSEATYTIRFAYDLDDLIAGTTILLDMQPGRRTRMKPTYVLFAILVLVAAIFMYLDDSPYPAIILFWFALTLYLASRAKSSRAAVSKLIRRNAEQGHYKELGMECQITIDQSGIIAFDEKKNEMRTSWDSVPRVVETDDCLFLYHGAQGAHYVPRKCVRSGSYDDFVAAVAQYKPVQKLATGQTFESTRSADERERARQLRLRSWKAFGAGMLNALIAFTLVYELLEKFLKIRFPPLLTAFICVWPVAAIGIWTAVWRISVLARRDRETRCRRCEHVLRGLTAPRCPECGEAI